MIPAPNPLSSIFPNQKESWKGKWFLTFDLDFAVDEVIEDTLELLSDFNVRATFFMTGPTDHVDRIRSNPLIDVGIHPNFNPLLDATAGAGQTAQDIISDLLSQFPEARSVRSHSLGQSTRINQLFSDAGLTHESNIYLPSGQVKRSAPWAHWTGMIRVPYHWQDSIFCLTESTENPEPMASELVMKADDFCVFNFHPIHVFLNTESMGRYEAARPFHREVGKLSDFRNTGYGTRDRLLELLRST